LLANLRQAEVDTGWNVVCDKYEALCDEISILERKIMDIPAHSLAGLRVKAMVGVKTNSDLWKKTMSDLDWDKQAARALIEAVCAVTGLEVPAEQIEEDA
jgi:hypothetical protein